MANLVSLCRFHHRRHHEGRFQIRPESSGDFTFVAADGKPLVVVAARQASGRLDLSGWTDTEKARARDGGAPMNLDYVVSTLADSSVFMRAAGATARAGPAP